MYPKLSSKGLIATDSWAEPNKLKSKSNADIFTTGCASRVHLSILPKLLTSVPNRRTTSNKH